MLFRIDPLETLYHRISDFFNTRSIEEDDGYFDCRLEDDEELQTLVRDVVNTIQRHPYKTLNDQDRSTFHQKVFSLDTHLRNYLDTYAPANLDDIARDDFVESFFKDYPEYKKIVDISAQSVCKNSELECADTAPNETTLDKQLTVLKALGSQFYIVSRFGISRGEEDEQVRLTSANSNSKLSKDRRKFPQL